MGQSGEADGNSGKAGRLVRGRRHEWYHHRPTASAWLRCAQTRIHLHFCTCISVITRRCVRVHTHAYMHIMGARLSCMRMHSQRCTNAKIARSSRDSRCCMIHTYGHIHLSTHTHVFLYLCMHTYQYVHVCM